MMSKALAGILVTIALLMAAALHPVSANSENGLRIYTIDEPFDDAKFNIENAIVDRGLKIDYTGHIGAMMERTAKDFPGAKQVYKNSEFFTFCSVPLTRTMVEAAPESVGFCPYIVFVYELLAEPGKSYVGYRRPVIFGSEASKKALTAIDGLLDSLVREAVE